MKKAILYSKIYRRAFRKRTKNRYNSSLPHYPLLKASIEKYYLVKLFDQGNLIAQNNCLLKNTYPRSANFKNKKVEIFNTGFNLMLILNYFMIQKTSLKQFKFNLYVISILTYLHKSKS